MDAGVKKRVADCAREKIRLTGTLVLKGDFLEATNLQSRDQLDPLDTGCPCVPIRVVAECAEFCA